MIDYLTALCCPGVALVLVFIVAGAISLHLAGGRE